MTLRKLLLKVDLKQLIVIENEEGDLLDSHSTIKRIYEHFPIYLYRKVVYMEAIDCLWDIPTLRIMVKLSPRKKEDLNLTFKELRNICNKNEIIDYKNGDNIQFYGKISDLIGRSTDLVTNISCKAKTELNFTRTPYILIETKEVEKNEINIKKDIT